MEYLSFQVRVCTMRSLMWIYFNILLVIWSSCYNTSVTGQRVKVEPEVLFYPGQTVNLRCAFRDPTGIQLTQVSWIYEPKEGARINIASYHPKFGTNYPDSPQKGRVTFTTTPPSMASPTIQITDVKMSDEGRYVCEIATYPIGNEQGITSLVMLAKPQNTASTVTVVAGEKMAVVARCESADGRPAAQISWVTTASGNATTASKADGNNMVTVTSEYKLVPRATDNGNDISCVVSHRTLNKPESFKMKLAVEFPPQVTIAGYDNNWYVGRSNVVLTCQATGNPIPSLVTWNMTGEIPDTVVIEQNKLTVLRVDISVNNTFVCEANNRLGVSKDQVTAVVREGRRSTAWVIAGIVTTVIIILVAAILGYLYWKKKKQTKRYKATASIICQGDEGQIFLQEPSESKEMTNMRDMSVEEEEQRDDIIPITSPEPRKWIQTSKRWRKQLEKLANIDDCKVTKVGSLVFVAGEEFCIAKGGEGTEVFLGLTEDGTEVAVKRMTLMSCYHMLIHEEQFLRLPKLDHPSIVRYIGFAKDETFGYLALQLCEFSLAEYITEQLSELERKQLAHQFLQSLSVLHRQDPKILHRDIKPQNVLIDIQSKARLSDFGISRELPEGQTFLVTKVAGTKHWKAKETLDNDHIPYKRSSDIQVAGMLIYYILSGGHHPFGKGARCEANILDGKYNLDHVQDVVAKDLIERMINEEPVERPRVEECLAHPYFWINKRRVEYLRRIGKEVDNCPDDDKDLITVLDQYAEQGQFNTWKHKLPLELKMDEVKSYPENSFGLLRFIHNLYEHYAEEAAGVDLMEMFPDLFGCVYQFAQKQDWNSRPTLKDMFQTEDVFTSSV